MRLIVFASFYATAACLGQKETILDCLHGETRSVLKISPDGKKAQDVSGEIPLDGTVVTSGQNYEIRIGDEGPEGVMMIYLINRFTGAGTFQGRVMGRFLGTQDMSCKPYSGKPL